MGNKQIIRCRDSGVFFGEVKERNGSEVVIKDVRCLWFWSGAASLLQLAAEGVKYPDNCKFTMTITELTVLDAIEIIPCTDVAIKSIDGVPTWKK